GQRTWRPRTDQDRPEVARCLRAAADIFSFPSSPMRFDETTYRDVVGAFYDAALEPSLWHDALVRASDALSAVGAMYISLDMQRPERSQYALGRLDPDLMQPYLVRHSLNCPWDKLPKMIPVGA